MENNTEKKLTLSMVLAAMKEGRFERVVRGLFVASDLDGVHAYSSSDGLEPKDRRGNELVMLTGAFHELCAAVISDDNPSAYGVVAEWYARGIKRRAAKESMLELLEKIGGEA